MKVLTIRLPDDIHTALKEAYWASIEKHRLSYNSWLVKVLDTKKGRTK